MIHAVDPGEKVSCHNKRKSCGCRPGAPCAQAHAIAGRWWDAWQEREEARKWCAYRDPTPPTLWSASSYGPERTTYEEAYADAIEGKFPKVILMNGHGVVLDTYFQAAYGEATNAR
jgi:hypothetical protein